MFISWSSPARRAQPLHVPGAGSSTPRVRVPVLGDLRSCAVPDSQQHLLRVIKIATLLAVVLENARFDDRVYGAAFLAEPAENAFGEVDVVARRPPRAVLAFLRFDRDRERGTHGLTQFARNAAFLAVRIAAQRMQSAEPRALRRLLLGKLNRDLACAHVPAREHEAAPELAQQPRVQDFARTSEHRRHRQWNSPAQRVCIITPRNTIHTSVTGMKTFQPRRMIWS